MTKKILLFVACAIMSWSAMLADEVTINAIKYRTYTGSNGSASVIGCEPGTKNLVVPAEITYNGQTLPVKYISGSAFENNTELISATIPGSVTSVSSGAYLNCTSLKKVTLLDGVWSVDAWCFQGCTSLEDISMTNSVKEIRMSAFRSCTSLKSIALPNSIEKIESFNFYECSALTHVEWPSSLKEIENNAFGYCKAFKQITNLPTSLRKINNSAFSFSGVRILYLPEGITELGNAFVGCNDLKVISLPSTLTTLSGFYGCKGLADIECRMTTPIRPDSDFDADVYYHAQLYVPKGCVGAYKNEAGWDRFIGITDEYSPFPLSDVNGDKVTGVSDANRLINMILAAAPTSTTVTT
ncbi:leucine-rich repeat domain-containing protein [Sodaliphilus sp.]|uniref:leucine-rich repeat domain-containing protein n=1 Tax=Sodaliphilus sp. TaxID=2815818 RepID=UPI00388D6980